MMHYRHRTLSCDEKQAKKFERKYHKWRKDKPRYKHYRKLVKTRKL